MNRKRRFDNENRKPWPWWKRAPIRVADFMYRLFVAPFMTRVGTNGDTSLIGGMTRWATAAFTAAVVYRITDPRFPPFGPWDAVMVFFVLYALAIDKALNASKPEAITDLLGKVLPGGGTASASQTSSVTVDPTPKDETHDA